MTLAEQWRIFRRILTIDLVGAFMYRGGMLVFMLSVVINPLLGLFVWRTAEANGADLPRDATFFTTYFLMSAVVNWLTSSWAAIFLANNIRSGYMIRYLIQPNSVFFRWISNNLSEKMVKGLFLLPLVLIAMLAFRDSISLPREPDRWLMFLVSVAAAAVLRFTSDVLVGCLAFWIEDVSAIERGRTMLIMILGGQVVPLVLMPGWLDGFLIAQPFRYFFSFPLEIITGDLQGQDLLLGFILQIVWLDVIVWGAHAVWKKGLRGYAAFGS